MTWNSTSSPSASTNPSLQPNSAHTTKPFVIFIVEDDPWFGELLEYQLTLNPDYEVHRFLSGKDLLSSLHLQPNVITLDLGLPDISGEKLLDLVKQQSGETPIVIISGQEDISLAVELLRKGVYDYLVKNENTKEQLWNTIIKIRENYSLKTQVAQLRKELGEKYDFEKTLKGKSPSLMKIFDLIQKAVKTNINVSITGETGTGKELVAKAIHYNSTRKDKPFLAVNMAAIPKELIESELFGHEKGAFTGAQGRKFGKFEEANKGTIFLDEIAELDLSLQSKLLRVLQEREVTPIGSNEVIKLDVRVIVATHKHLSDEVKKGTFREDLYYRLMGLPIELPPLRERGNDILLLAKYFADEFCGDNGLPNLTLHQSARDKLMAYNFPGNVRELKSIIDLAVVMSDGQELRGDDITYVATRGDETFTAIEKSLRAYTLEIIRYYLRKYNNDVLLVADKTRHWKIDHL
jgi:two-component system, NtrC family, response regulator AtoC